MFIIIVHHYPWWLGSKVFKCFIILHAHFRVVWYVPNVVLVCAIQMGKTKSTREHTQFVWQGRQTPKVWNRGMNLGHTIPLFGPRAALYSRGTKSLAFLVSQWEKKVLCPLWKPLERSKIKILPWNYYHEPKFKFLVCLPNFKAK